MNEADENVYPSIVGNPQLRVSDTVKFQLTNLSAVKVERTVEEEGGAKTVYDLRFTWENSGTAAQPLSYVVTDKESYQSIEEGTLTEGAVEFVLEDVANNKYYEFKVICSDNGREYTAGALTADTVAPRQATNLSVAVEQQTFTVSFDPPADDDYAGAEIYLDGELAGKIAAGVQSFTISDLKSEKTYTIAVVAVDSFGNRSEEAAVTATTQRKDFYGEWLQDTDLESPGVTIIEITE